MLSATLTQPRRLYTGPPGSGAWRRRTARPVQLDLFEELPETALSGAQLPHVLRARAGVPGVPSAVSAPPLRAVLRPPGALANRIISYHSCAALM